MNIGVFFGGKNPEHDISIITGQLIISSLREIGHNPVPVYITKQGKWVTSPKLDNIDFFKNLKNQKDLNEFEEVTITIKENPQGIEITRKGLFKESVKIDLAFPALHGQNGEDGTIQGLFELLNIPYVGCPVTASAMAIDKVLTKLFYQRFNFPTTKFVYFDSIKWEEEKENILKDVSTNLAWPVFVKPSRLGSSIGMTKARTDEELVFAIEVALHYDSKVLVEESVEDLMDITVAVLGNKTPTASLIQESSYTKDFFSYEDKYLKEGGAQTGNAQKSIIIPANLDEKTTAEIREMAVEIYKLFGCSGTARVDFLYDKTFKKYYANEINTLPGTLYHHLWSKSGIEVTELVKKLIELALENHKEKNKITYTFDSSVLQNTGSGKMKLKGI